MQQETLSGIRKTSNKMNGTKHLIEKTFKDFGMFKGHIKYQNATSRLEDLYRKDEDIRHPFERDYHRILYSNAYRRLKHKTQVFFNTNNDHICTRIEHVNHVSSVAETIAEFLGLNPWLVRAIAVGHDLGHSPFGHTGEKILNKIVRDNKLSKNFWHEKNSLRFIDKIETMPDYEGYERNLNLSYAVRDGIICHCGEVDEEALKPRDEFIDLESIQNANQFQSYTYEGCVVKISDKIAYLGRDIEDALSKRILEEEQKVELEGIVENLFGHKKLKDINTTSLVHLFIIDLCKNSNPNDGLKFSKEYFEIMKTIKRFNYQNIYSHPRLKTFEDYASLIINTIFNKLLEYYSGADSIYKLQNDEKFYPILCEHFKDWLLKYSNASDKIYRDNKKFINKIIYDINDVNDYKIAIVDFISGMTDSFSIKIFNELIAF